MASPGPKRTHTPPQVDIDDGGVRWTTSGQSVHIQRRLTVLAVLWPIVVFLIFVWTAYAAFSAGHWVPGAVVVLAALLFGVFVWIRIIDRFDIRLGPDGLAWEHTRPRHFVGSWAAKDLEGVRIVYGEEPTGWGHRRLISVQLRRRGAWTSLATGHKEKRAKALAEAVALSRGWAIAEHDEDKDGALPR